MYEIFKITVVAIALSMDTFSVSLSLGTANITKKDSFLLSIIVGIMHFIMPLIGLVIGSIILEKINVNAHLLLAFIFLTLIIKMIHDLFVEKNDQINLSLLGIFVYAFSVSLDAFSTGIGLSAITNKYLISSTIFMFISSLFTLLGIKFGKMVNKKIGKVSSIIGIIILIITVICLII